MVEQTQAVCILSEAANEQTSPLCSNPPVANSFFNTVCFSLTEYFSLKFNLQILLVIYKGHLAIGRVQQMYASGVSLKGVIKM